MQRAPRTTTPLEHRAPSLDDRLLLMTAESDATTRVGKPGIATHPISAPRNTASVKNCNPIYRWARQDVNRTCTKDIICDDLDGATRERVRTPSIWGGPPTGFPSRLLTQAPEPPGTRRQTESALAQRQMPEYCSVDDRFCASSFAAGERPQRTMTIVAKFFSVETCVLLPGLTRAPNLSVAGDSGVQNCQSRYGVRH